LYLLFEENKCHLWEFRGWAEQKMVRLLHQTWKKSKLSILETSLCGFFFCFALINNNNNSSFLVTYYFKKRSK
jgi:hypothetical protein